MPGETETNRAAALDRTPEERAAHAEALRLAEMAGRSLQNPSAGPGEPSYYDISILKRPVWKWEIANYFFWGGLSAGAYILSCVADRFGGEHHRDLTRTGTLTSFVSMLPCAPLLIKDLGDPARFHHMLRVWKPSTPMNLGTWTLTAYSGAVTAAVLREYMRDKDEAERRSLGRLTDATVLAIRDAAGLPLAILMAGYTGVLLSCTANPLWSKNGWLGPLFSASAVSTGAEAIGLALDARGSGSEKSHHALERIDTVAHAAEAATLAGYLHQAGDKADTLKQGKMKQHLWMSIGGLVVAELLKLLPMRGKGKRWTRMLAAAVGLVAGYSLRWGMVYGGKEAAGDPHTARLASRPSDSSTNASDGDRPWKN